jgi:hypothetical protein
MTRAKSVIRLSRGIAAGLKHALDIVSYNLANRRISAVLLASLGT